MTLSKLTKIFQSSFLYRQYIIFNIKTNKDPREYKFWVQKLRAMEIEKKSKLPKNMRRQRQQNTRAELEQLSKEQLIERVLSVESYNQNLKNTMEKKFTEKLGVTDYKRKRNFDFTKFHKRHILLKFYYLGWDYQGFVTQDGGLETVELHLFNALIKTCMIESRETANYNRCGRTDCGVSAFSQVVSLDIKSRVEPRLQLTEEGVKSEYDYCNSLNRALPKSIRAYAWMPLASNSFSARFDCIDRTYRYFFPRGNLDIGLMQEACNNFVGLHDFRNFCKTDVAHGVINFDRRLLVAEIKLVTKHESEEYDMFCLEIQGSAFLWHMIRSIMAILLLVGEKKEAPSVVKELLDVTKNDRKPNYSLAHEIPLNLFFCNYREDVLGEDDLPRHHPEINKWIFSEQSLRFVIGDLQSSWCMENVKSTMIHEMLKVLQQEYAQTFPEHPKVSQQIDILNLDNRRKNHSKLMTRQKGMTLEERLETRSIKRKFNEIQENEDDKKEKEV